MIANPKTPLRLQQPLDEAIQDKNVGKIIGHITTHPDSPNVRAPGSDAMGSLTLDASSSQPPSSSDEDLLALSKADLIALLKTERKAKEKEPNNFAKTLKELNEKVSIARMDARGPTVVAQSLDANDPNVKVVNNVLSKVLVTNNCSFTTAIHEVPTTLFSAITSSQNNASKKRLFQEVLHDVTPAKGAIVYWSYMIDSTKFCDFLLSLKVMKKAEDEIVIKVASVDEEELEDTTLPSPHPIATKSYRLLLNDGLIALRPLPIGQTSFTFTAQVVLAEKVEKAQGFMRLTLSKTGDASRVTNKIKSSLSSRKSRGFGETLKADDLFCRIATFFYNRFEQEKVMDQRMKEDFIKNIGNAPKLTEGEQGLIAQAMEVVRELSKAKRIAGTVTDSVEKFLYHPAGGAVWAKTRAIIDVSPMKLFAELWLLDTYELKAEMKHMSVRRIFKNIDGTRSQQYNRSLSLPGAFQDRIFRNWMTWDVLDDDTYIIAICPITEYKGTRHKTVAEVKTIEATSRGVYIIKKLTENTCEWTRAQVGDLKIGALPAQLLDFLARQQLGKANEVQEKHRRNGWSTDKEKIDEIAKVMVSRRGEPWMEDQVAVYNKCKKIMDQEGWQALKQPSHDVKIWMNYTPPSIRGRSVGSGKSIGVIDCSAEEAAAWMMDYCSNERMRVLKEEGDPARLELKELARVNERTFGTIKKFPFLMDNREFVARLIWKSEEGKVTLVMESVDAEVDYGDKLRKTKGTIAAFYLIENLPDREGVKQCKMTFVQNLDLGGGIPMWAINKLAPKHLSSIQNVIESFRQDAKIDAAERWDLRTLMRDEYDKEVYSETEIRVMSDAASLIKEANSHKARVIFSGDPQVVFKLIYLDNDNLMTGVAECVVDAEMEEIAAWDYLKTTRSATKAFYERGGVEKFIEKVNNHSYYYLSRRDLKVPGLKHREWRTVVVWKKEGESKMIVLYNDTGALDEKYRRDPRRYVVGSSRTTWEYERLPEVEGISQTKVKLVTRVDIAGAVPSLFMNRLVKSYGGAMIQMRKHFDRSVDIDDIRRVNFAKLIKHENSLKKIVSAEALKQIEAIFEERPGSMRPSKNFGLADSKVHADVIGGHAWCKTSIKIHAEIEEVAAFFWDFGSRANMENSGDVERTYADDESRDFRKIVTVQRRLEAGHRDRIFASKMSLEWVDDDTIIVLMLPLEKVDMYKRNTVRARGSMEVNNSGAIEATETVAIRLSRWLGGNMKLEYACELNMGFGVGYGTNLHFVERRAEEIADISIFFSVLQPPEEFGVEDGQALGLSILWKAPSSKKRVERLHKMFKEARVMKELEEQHPAVKAMLVTAVKGSLNMKKVVRTKLDCLTESDAVQIGNNLISALMTDQLASAGVNQWKVQNRAVKELMEKYEWFEPMILVVSKGIVKTAGWGLMSRVAVGAMLSMSDFGTDVLVLMQFWEEGEERLTFRYLTLFSLSVSILIQVAFVIVQNRKKSLLRILKEIFVVTIGMKFPWDAYRVASGAEHEPGCQYDPMTEMTITKIMEIFAESIPAILIQSSAVLQTLSLGKEITMTTYISLFVSMLTTGFVSATISYDFDTDPLRRTAKPDFYGYIPDAHWLRVVSLLILTNISSCMVILKSLLVVALGFLSPCYALGYIGGGVALHWLMKALAGDLTHWTAPVSGIAGFIHSLLIRLMVKLVTDFTACVQFRHPNEVGGLFFSINILSSTVGMIVLLICRPEGSFNAEIENLIVNTIIYAGGTLLVSSVIFYFIIKKEFRPTFYTTETGMQSTRRQFIDSDSDEARSKIFNYNDIMLRPIMPKIEHWILTNWFRWLEEKPEFFTDRWRALVPPYMIPEGDGDRGSYSSGGESGPEEKGGGGIATTDHGGRDDEGAPHRRQSFLEGIFHGDGIGKKTRRASTSKVMPSLVKKTEGEFDANEFKFEMRRRGTNLFAD
ncbi:hypothetical protein TrLO_g10802 [Triparma laevis f. longispina]|uniref:START domain-containing protein n=1 Tax=Triparma laevis f. longispina TaxID=1714387 RepID=A0A9W7FR41_9STRA|nr:hypothetical protein TrLO_g10802 [Triparma laevis f. longispina]